VRNEYGYVIVAAPAVLTTITALVVSEYGDAVLPYFYSVRPDGVLSAMPRTTFERRVCR
jgi:hypothetical protein